MFAYSSLRDTPHCVNLDMFKLWNQRDLQKVSCRVPASGMALALELSVAQEWRLDQAVPAGAAVTETKTMIPKRLS
jgi:hypothetical protein